MEKKFLKECELQITEEFHGCFTLAGDYEVQCDQKHVTTIRGLALENPKQGYFHIALLLLLTKLRIGQKGFSYLYLMQ